MRYAKSNVHEPELPDLREELAAQKALRARYREQKKTPEEEKRKIEENLQKTQAANNRLKEEKDKLLQEKDKLHRIAKGEIERLKKEL